MIDFRLLGTLALTDARGASLESLLAQPRRLALLAYLAAATPRGPRRRDTLLPLFWPELDQTRARAALRQALHVLRGVLGSDVVKTRGDEEIELDGERLRCDVVEFERALAAGDPDEALERYRGHLLEGFFIPDAPGFEQWLETERARLCEAAVGAARTLIGRAEKAGDGPAASRWARRAVRFAPLDEDLLRQLVGILDHAGDRAGALAAYEEFARRMAAEFDARPAAETQAQIAAVRSREVSAMPQARSTIPASQRATDATPVTSVPAAARRPRPLRWAFAFLIAGGIIVTGVLLRHNAGSGTGSPPAGFAAAASRRGGIPTANRVAYDLYLRGQISLLNEDRKSDSIAIGYLEHAVRLDPTFAVAYAALAHAYGLRATQFTPTDSDAYVRATIARDEAFALHPDLPEGHFATAFLLWGPNRQFAHELAIAEDRRAIALNPDLAVAHHHLGMIFLHLGLLDSAIAEFRRTLALDPDQLFAQQRIGIAQVYQGRYQDGLRTFEQVPAKANPVLWHYQLVWVLLYLGRDTQAQTVIAQSLRERPRDPGGVVTATRAVLEAKRGDARHAEADIRSAIRIGTGFQHFHHAAYSIAMAYALLHRPGPAVQFLREAASDGLPCYPCFANDPFLAEIKSDSGFQRFMGELKGEWLHNDSLLARPVSSP